ncbi:hypothetical protein [Enterobacter sp. PTB]|uniref:hypothetical protein n=1 Tax=Enterobacter sp. PTB TaxID=3143437 RepID=UPI003DA9CFE3
MENDSKTKITSHLLHTVFPVPKNGQGHDFLNLDDMLAHAEGEATGFYLVGRSGMWHPGIHLTSDTTPWCALSGQAATEQIDFPVAFRGEQAVRCMAEGEVVAYRICQDYLKVPWMPGELLLSGSFLLVRHYIQPGETEKSGLQFYTLYMHLAPYSAYEATQDKPLWCVQNALSAYHPDWLMAAPTHNPDSVNSSYRAGTIPKGAIVEWDESDDSLHVTGFGQRKYGLVTYRGLNEEAQEAHVKTSLNPGQQYWMLVDNHNIEPGTGSVVRPAWWRSLMPPAKGGMIFDQVVCPEPFAIRAGEPVGHMGYFQAPKDGSYVSRYQVHIECFSMDDNLPDFLSNPEKVDEDKPLWLRYSPGLELYSKNIRAGTFAKDDRVTGRCGLLKLSELRTETDATTTEEYWQLLPENGYVSKTQMQPFLVSQYDLGKRGFRTEIAEPSSFDYLDGKTQPAGLVRRIFEWMLEAAKNDPRPSHAMAKHGYQYLLNKIDSGERDYSSGEYLRAIHRKDYRDVLQKAIVKHPSDWYHKKGDAIWQTYLAPLKKEAPEWKTYGEHFIDKMTWMQDVTTERLGPSPWHMHPLVFLDAINARKAKGWAHSPFANLIGNAESVNNYTAYNRTHPHLEVHTDPNLTSMTIAQVMAAQKNREMFATGRFQITPPVLQESVHRLKLDVNARYDEAMQDRMFEEYIIRIKRKPIIAYLEGQGSVEDAAYACAEEFASVGVQQGRPISPDPHAFERTPDGHLVTDKHGHPVHKKRYALQDGVTYYAGDGLNRALITPDAMIKALEASKNEGK